MDTLRELLIIADAPPIAPDLLSPTSSRTLSDCFSIFPLIHLAVSTSSALRRVLRETLEDFEDDNVRYLELRTTPRILDGGKVDKRGYVDVVISTMSQWVKENRRLIPRLIISVDRSKSVDEARENVDIAVELFRNNSEFVVGVDLGGNPTRGNFSEFKDVFERARGEGIKVTIHAGEVVNDEEVNEIVEWRPDRLGHFLKVNKGVWKKMEMNGGDIPIEICPTSNVMTLGLQGLNEHPTLKKLIDEGYPISVNTDDKGVFNTQQSDELYMIAKEMGFNEYTVGGLVWGAVDLVFEGNRRVRARLARDVMKGIKGYLEALEKEDGIN